MGHSTSIGEETGIWSADSFQGLPEAASADKQGTARVGVAGDMQTNEDTFWHNLDEAGFPKDSERVVLLREWFNETLPSAPVKQTSFLRLDGDRYVSTIDALVALYDRVSDGAPVYVNDYGSFNGCKVAVTEEQTSETPGAFKADHDDREELIQNTQANDEQDDDKLPLVIPLIVKMRITFKEQQPTPFPMASSNSNNSSNGALASIPVSNPSREEPIWGLNVMKEAASDKPIESTPNPDSTAVKSTPMTEDERGIAAPISEACGGTASNTIITSLPILAENGTLRPEEPTLDEYNKVLRGIGWKEGERLGKPKTVVAPILSARRPALLRLGAKPPPMIENKTDKKRIPKPNVYKPELILLHHRHCLEGIDQDPDSILDFRIDDKVVCKAGKNEGDIGYKIEKEDSSGELQSKVDLNNGDVVKAYSDEVKLYSKSTKGASDYRDSPSKQHQNRVFQPKWLQDVIPGQGAIVKTSRGDIVDHIVDKHVETYVPSAGKAVVDHDIEINVCRNRDRVELIMSHAQYVLNLTDLQYISIQESVADLL
ncbi:hypothetical protein SmJEL517_g05732 [Synchytrium microbalum]|uniref:Spp2/MOS2 G-patch domain-containing protein n=1 Tax=Synchytrium microbalum TaxID=1806994 RepID=A0A507BZS3_9FUNG|nr:uncharacterized protein SmJEL517_g05732 [Synchytrium microbalum]TPX30763.1 hypothetical protein SmJEL517_g05732 [Synchytrium microbalum]